MNVITEYGEIVKHIRIDKFSHYWENEDFLTTVISVNLEGFRSEWKVIVYPMHATKQEETSAVHCNVVLELVCLHSSAPPLDVKKTKITAWVKGRENYSKVFKYKDNQIWKDVLISRVVLYSTNIIHEDIFEFHIKFEISQDILNHSEDGKIAVVKHLETILREPQFFDICLISSSGTKFYAHSSLLHSRSNIMQTAKVLSSSQHSDEYQSISSESSVNPLSSSETDPSSNNAYYESRIGDSIHSTDLSIMQRDRELKHEIPLFTVPSPSSKGTPSLLYSPRKMDNGCDSPLTLSPMKRGLCQNSLSTPNKKRNKNSTTPSKISTTPSKLSKTPSKISTTPSKLSRTPSKMSITPSKMSTTPKKSIQMQLTQFFPRSSTLNSSSESEKSDLCKAAAYLSPVKSQMLNGSLSSSIKSTQTDISSSTQNQCKENVTPSKGILFPSGIPSVDSVIRSPCGTLPNRHFQEVNNKLTFGDLDKKIKILKLNMSTSVLQELLCWIYTGESSRLQELCRPLLVASLRHSIDDLSRAAQYHMASILCVENACEMLLLSHKYKASYLEEEAMKFALSHASDVTSCGRWTDLSLQYPEILLSFTRRLAATKS